MAWKILSNIIDPPEQRRRNAEIERRAPKRLTPTPMSRVRLFAILGVTALVISSPIWVMVLIGTYLCTFTSTIPDYKCGNHHAPPVHRDIDLRAEKLYVSDKTNYQNEIHSCWNDPNLEFRLMIRNDGSTSVEPRSAKVTVTGTSNDGWTWEKPSATGEMFGYPMTSGDGYTVGYIHVAVPPGLKDKQLTWTATVTNDDDHDTSNNTTTVVLGPCGK